MADSHTCEEVESIVVQALQGLTSRGYTLTACARFLGLGDRADSGAERRMRRWARRMGITAAPIDDDTLLGMVYEICDSNPRIGYHLAWNMIRSLGYNVTRERVWEMMVRLDPSGALRRARLHTFLVRRVYWAPRPNHVWHVDTHAKLAKYGLTIFGAIDGFSKKVLYLHCTNRLDAGVHPRLHLAAVGLFNVPDLLRCDEGSENPALRILQEQILHARYIEGQSVHNQPIEAYWRQ
eukprot:gene2575-7840_t